MSKESIRSLLEAQGSFPDKNQSRAGFEALFALAAEQRETVDDLAWGFLLALDQWSHVDAALEPAVAERLRDWTLSQWATSPYERCVQLCALLVNLPSPAVLAFLQAQRQQCTDADIQRVLDDAIADIQSEASDAG